jgi:hypothetical protein
MLSVERPNTRYAWNGDNALAYQVVGDGPDDLIYLQGVLSNVVLNWERPASPHEAHDTSAPSTREAQVMFPGVADRSESHVFGPDW